MSRTRYLIQYSEEAEINIRLLPKEIQRRLLKAIEQRLTTAPNDYGEPLRYNLKNHRRLRCGDYRIIYKIFEDKVVVFIVDVDHRKDIYE